MVFTSKWLLDENGPCQDITQNTYLHQKTLPYVQEKPIDEDICLGWAPCNPKSHPLLKGNRGCRRGIGIETNICTQLPPTTIF
jgi:hypothetical protein